MAKIIIFGVQDSAELAYFYLTHDSEHDVAGFCVSREYLDEATFQGLPVVAFEDVEKLYPTRDFKLFAPMMATNMNQDRERIYQEATAKGYELISYISSKATLFPGADIGNNCFILEDNTIQPFVRIGNNVVLWSGNHIGHHSEIKDHVFFTSQVVLSGHCVVESHCYIGVNATIRDRIHLADSTFVAMGANLAKDTEKYGVYVGNPARKSPKSSSDIVL